MPSLTHESLVTMFRVTPALAVDVLRTVLGITVPAFDRVTVVDADATDAVPTEFRTDGVVLLWARDARGVERCVLVIIVEAQLGEDGDKLYSWPVYAAVMRARRRCPAYVLAVAPDEATARWASQPIAVSPGAGTWHALVLGPREVPHVERPEYAREHPELTVMSALMHANGDVHGEAVVRAIPAALGALDLESGRLYLLTLRQVLRPALRALLEALMIEKTPFGELEVPEWLYKAEQAARQKGLDEGVEKGVERGLAQSILTVLSARGLTLSDAEREKVLACSDPKKLQRWLRRSVTARTVAAVFKPVPKKRRAH